MYNDETNMHSVLMLRKPTIIEEDCSIYGTDLSNPLNQLSDPKTYNQYAIISNDMSNANIDWENNTYDDIIDTSNPPAPILPQLPVKYTIIIIPGENSYTSQ